MEDGTIAWRGFILIAFICIAIGGVASMIGGKSTFLIWMAHHRNIGLDYFFYYITKLAEPAGYILLGVLLWISSWKKMLIIPILAVLSALITYGLKSFFQHERPALFLDRIEWIGPTDVLDYHLLTGHSSFPSGHSMAIWALCTLAVLFFRKSWVAILCLAIGISVSLSRVYLMAHFLQDVVMGAIIGIGLGYGLFIGYERLTHKSGPIAS